MYKMQNQIRIVVMQSFYHFINLSVYKSFFLGILSSGLKGNIEELPLRPARPPLGGTIGGQSRIVNLLSQPGPCLVSQLEEDEVTI